MLCYRSLLYLQHVAFQNSQVLPAFLWADFHPAVFCQLPFRVSLKETAKEKPADLGWLSFVCYPSVLFSDLSYTTLAPFYHLLTSLLDQVGAKLSLGVRRAATGTAIYCVLRDKQPHILNLYKKLCEMRRGYK